MHILLNNRFFFILLLALAMCYPVPADHVPQQTPETQVLNTVTSIQVAGLASESEDIVWQLSSRELDNRSLSMPFLSFLTPNGIVVWNIPGVTTNAGATGETQYTVSYSEDTFSDQGSFRYVKQNSLDTSNKPSNQENIRTDKIVAFDGATTGRMTSSEDLLVDGASEFERTSEAIICPFASAIGGVIPPFCNIVEMGSAVDIRDGALHTSSGERSVAVSADVPVEAGYSIVLSSLEESPASGSATAYMHSRLQEGKMQLIKTIYGPPGFSLEQYTVGNGVVFTYSEETTTSGEISCFSKDMRYESGVRRVS